MSGTQLTATEAPSPQSPAVSPPSVSDAATTTSAAPTASTTAIVAMPGTPVSTAANTELGGTLIPNRVFVGGIPSSATEAELMEFFSALGEVRDVKIIADKSGTSKGYGFVTFESAELADSIIRRDRESRDGLVFRSRRLNIGPAIKKSPLYHRPDSNSNGVFFTAGSVPYTYQNGMAVFHIPGSLYQHYHHQQHQLALGGGGGYPDGGGPGPFLSATSDYGTDPSCTDQSYANESVEFDCGQLYSQQQPQQLAAAYSPAAPGGYCYGSPPVLCPVRAFPVLLNQHQPQLATPPPPAPVARIVSLDSADDSEVSQAVGGAPAAVPQLLQMPLQPMADPNRSS
uniref:RRM domain-containing protein n=1 Tax=Macrostomum lignano TaxID=282301 RepID=A0A1I8I162_9PLAT